MAAGDGAAEVAELIDTLGHLRPDDDQGPAPPGQGRRRGQGGGFESLQPHGRGRPVACTLPAAAQLLGVSPQRLRAAAQQVQPYTHHDGSPRWSVMLLERALGQKPRQGRGSGSSSAWRGRSIHG